MASTIVSNQFLRFMVSYLATLETSETTSEVLERSEALEAVCPMKNITNQVRIYRCLEHGVVQIFNI